MAYTETNTLSNSIKRYPPPALLHCVQDVVLEGHVLFEMLLFGEYPQLGVLFEHEFGDLSHLVIVRRVVGQVDVVFSLFPGL